MGPDVALSALCQTVELLTESSDRRQELGGLQQDPAVASVGLAEQ